MKERPILFNSPMVRAILDGTKTQTRRVVKGAGIFTDPKMIGEQVSEIYKCPYGQPGDRLWVRETWQAFEPRAFETIPLKGPMAKQPGMCLTGFEATEKSRFETLGGKLFTGPWRPSIHMPRWASRITLEITSVRVERLQDITKADVIAEGIVSSEFEGVSGEKKYLFEGRKEKYWDKAEWAYQDLYESIYGTGSWESNPWVWVVEFRMVQV